VYPQAGGTTTEIVVGKGSNGTTNEYPTNKFNGIIVAGKRTNIGRKIIGVSIRTAEIRTAKIRTVVKMTANTVDREGLQTNPQQGKPERGDEEKQDRRQEEKSLSEYEKAAIYKICRIEQENYVTL
jgi:hypothetical protein